MELCNHKIIVLAGNYKEFQRFISLTYNPSQFVYGGNPNLLQSVEAVNVIQIGTYWQRADYESLIEIIKTKIRGVAKNRL